MQLVVWHHWSHSISSHVLPCPYAMTPVPSNSIQCTFVYFNRFYLSSNDFGFSFSPMGSGCGKVGRAVASDTRVPRFESSHRQLLLNVYLLLTVCGKDENKEYRPGMAHLKKSFWKLFCYQSSQFRQNSSRLKKLFLSSKMIKVGTDQKYSFH